MHEEVLTKMLEKMLDKPNGENDFQFQRHI